MSDTEPAIVISTDELARRLQGDRPPHVVFVGDADVYASGHIPTAGRVDFADLNHTEPPASGLLPPMAVLGEVLGNAGIRPDQTVIAYDDSGGGRASRLVWTLHALGHWRAGILDGGLAAWREDGHPLTSGELDPGAGTAPYPAELRCPEVVAGEGYIREHLDDPGVCILDARSPAEYRGEDVRAARGGHIPGAVNVDWGDNRDPRRSGRLRPLEELDALYRSRGLRRDQEIVAHCQTHHRSSLSYVVLRHLGFEHVRGYAGSWSEWGNRPDTPVITGPEPFPPENGRDSGGAR